MGCAPRSDKSIILKRLCPKPTFLSKNIPLLSGRQCTKIVIFLLLSVGIGFVGGFVAQKLMKVLLRNAKWSVNHPLMTSQYITSGLLAFIHGANDAQKAMGMMVLVIASAGWASNTNVPLWVMVACASAMTIGTLGGGWKIIKTLGRRYSISGQFTASTPRSARPWRSWYRPSLVHRYPRPKQWRLASSE